MMGYRTAFILIHFFQNYKSFPIKSAEKMQKGFCMFCHRASIGGTGGRGRPAAVPLKDSKPVKKDPRRSASSPGVRFRQCLHKCSQVTFRRILPASALKNFGVRKVHLQFFALNQVKMPWKIPLFNSCRHCLKGSNIFFKIQNERMYCKWH